MATNVSGPEPDGDVSVSEAPATVRDFSSDVAGAELLQRMTLVQTNDVALPAGVHEALRLVSGCPEAAHATAPPDGLDPTLLDVVNLAHERRLPLDILASVMGTPSPLDDREAMDRLRRLCHRRGIHWHSTAEVIGLLWRQRENYQLRCGDHRKSDAMASALRDQGVVELGRKIDAAKAGEILGYFVRRPFQAGHVPGMCADPLRRRYFGKNADHFPFGNHGPSDIVLAPHILEEIFSPLILDIGFRYLGCIPKIQHLYATWSFPGHENYEAYGRKISVTSLHRDLSDFGQFWVYVYLTDVAEDGGPHAYVESSDHLTMIQKAMDRFGHALIDGRPLEALDFFDGFGYHLPDDLKNSMFSDCVKAVTGPRRYDVPVDRIQPAPHGSPNNTSKTNVGGPLCTDIVLSRRRPGRLDPRLDHQGTIG